MSKRSPIEKSTGQTETEKLLAKITEKTFLKLWSFPNLYIDKKLRGSGDGVELCDNLIVFGDSVIVISDKYIQFHLDAEINVAWPRWYRKAVEHSVKQIEGAIRWIKNYPDRIYLDKECTKPFPLHIPTTQAAKFYAICAVGGIEKALEDFFIDGEDDSIIFSQVKGSEHCGAVHMPFTFGDVNPEKTFVHVFDQRGLETIFRELDTASDLLRYLDHRSRAIRQEGFFMCSSEADLLAYYMMNEDENGQHFILPKDTPRQDIVVQPALFKEFKKRPEYRAKHKANRVSYAWDNLINSFSTNLLEGTTVVVSGEEPKIQDSEFALRLIAQESRFSRRELSIALLEALEHPSLKTRDRFTRTVFSLSSERSERVSYSFMVLIDRSEDFGKTYDDYRSLRAHMLSVYCHKILLKESGLDFAVGFGFDAPKRYKGKSGGSEDLIVVRIEGRTEELVSEIEDMAERYQILTSMDEIGVHRRYSTEFPELRRSKKKKTKKLFRP